MKRFFALGLLLMAFLTTIQARPVNLQQAYELGAKFLAANTTVKSDHSATLQWIKTYCTADNTPAFYVLNSEHGFVIVSADDCATPILGYSDEGPFDPDNHPAQMEAYLQRFVEQIQYGIENHLEADEATARQWNSVRSTGFLLEERSTTVVEPLVTALWGQGCYYNNLCPWDAEGNCGHVLVGCVAVAMGQIMHYWGYPTTGVGSHTYTPLDSNNHLPSGYPQQTANFGATTYNWSNMPNALSESSSSEQVNAVATLLWHCGVSVEMMYGISGSGAYSIDVPAALIDHFRYDTDMQYIYRDNYLTDGWLGQIKSSLNMGRPVYYSATDSGGHGGHAFVCDGYDVNNLLHMNWGWYGNHNNYFADGALNASIYYFNSNVAAITHIHPQNTGDNYWVEVHPNPSYGGVVTGTGIYGNCEVCTVSATAHEGYAFEHWLKDGSVVSTDATFSFIVHGDIDLTAHFIHTDPNLVEASYYPDPDVPNSTAVKISWNCGPPDPLSGDLIADFEDGTLGEWTTIDADGDGNDWFVWASETSLPAGHNESVYTATSASYQNYALFPDNYLVSPQVALGGVLHFWACAQDASYASEYFGVAISLLSNTNPNDFITIQAWWMTAKDSGISTRETRDGSRVQGNWYEYTVDLSSYSGAIGYVAIRHFNCCDNFRLNVDDIELTVPHKNRREILFSDDLESTSLSNPLLEDKAISDSTNYFYNVYRTHASNNGPYTEENTTLVAANLTSSPYIDFAWNNLEEGNYKYGVNYVEEGDEEPSEIYWSNPLLKGSGYQITALANPGPGGTVTGGGRFAAGELCTLTATANENYDFVNWTKYGAVVSEDATFTFTVTENADYYAHFVAKTYTVTTSASPAGAGVVTPSGTYSYGSVCNLEANTNSGYTFQYWTVNGNPVSYYYNYSFIVTEDALCVAQYVEMPTFTISAYANPAAGGVVTGGGTYYPNQTCTLTATANTGYQFDHWTKNGTVISNGSSFSFSVSQNATYVAFFEPKSYQVNVSVSPSQGGVPMGAGTYAHGATATVRVNPNENYVFQNWTENGVVVATTQTYSFTVTSNRQLKANMEYIDAVEELNTGRVMLYPNPVADKLTVETEEPVRQCEVYNVQGALVFRVGEEFGTSIDLDVKPLPAGTYLIRLTTDSAVLTRRFVKQ